MPAEPEYDIDRPCDGCPNRCGDEPKSRAKLRKGAKFLVVGKAPTYQMIQRGEHITGAAMKTFAKAMVKAGFDKEDFSFANSVRCDFDQTTYPTSEKKEINARCRHHLLKVIRHAKPEVVIPLGADAAKAVYGRAVKITKVRGVPEVSEELDATILAMTDPVQVNMYPQNRPLLESDCRTLARIYDYEYDLKSAEEDVLGDYQLVDDLQFLIDEDPPNLAVDAETLGLRFAIKSNKILTLQFCPEPGRAYLLSWDHPDRPMPHRKRKKIRRQLEELLCKPGRNLIGQNFKFDASWLLAKMGIHVRIGDDTLMLAATHDENLQSKDLDTLTKIHAPEMAGYADTFNATYDKSRMDLVPLDRIVGYGCGDTDASFRIWEALKPLVYQDEKLWNNYRYVSMPGLNAFLQIEQGGMLISRERLADFEKVLAEQVQEQFDSLIKQVPKSILRAHAEKGLKFTRRDFLQDILFRHPDGFKLTPRVYTKSTENLEPSMRVPSTSTKDHLPYFFDSCPFTFELAEYIKNERVLGTNVRRFRDNYMEGEYIYPVYSLSTAVTGRTSSRDPNGQNFPKRGKTAKAYRKIFIPHEGMVLLEADLSQAELRIAGDMANDKVMIDIYNSGGDIHRRTATIVMGCTLDEFSKLDKEEQSLARFKAKAVNFGFLYGMGWRSFISYAKTQYGVEFTERESQRIRAGFFSTYKGLEPWHRRMKEFATEHGFVRSYSGRVRHLPMVYSAEEGIRAEALRQAINSPVQEFGSSLGVMSLSRLTQTIDPAYMRLYGFVHDALYAEVPAKYVEWGAKTLKYYMETNPLEEWFGRKLKLPIVADVGFGMNGSDTHEMETLDLDKPYDFSLHELDFELPAQKIPPYNGEFELEEHLKTPEEIHLYI